MQKYNTLNDLESLFFDVTAVALGLDPAAEEVQRRIRISWPVGTDSSPGWEHDENIVFLRIEKSSDTYSLPEWSEYVTDENGDVFERVNRTEAHRVTWIFYGDNASEDSALMRAMLTREVIREKLLDHGLKVVAGIRQPERVDEYMDNLWWHRCDLYAEFYEHTIRDFAADTIGSADINTIRDH